MREYPRGPQDVPFLQPKKSPEPTPKGKVEEVFTLPGLFKEAEMQTRMVGDSFFRFPSTTDIAHRHIFYEREGGLEAADKIHGTNHVRSVTNIIDWINKGIAALDEAKGYESDPSKDLALANMLKEARTAFWNAQVISEQLSMRYHPQSPIDKDWRPKEKDSHDG